MCCCRVLPLEVAMRGRLRTFQPLSAQAELDELRGPIVAGLAMALVALAWAWIAIAATVQEGIPELGSLATPGVLLVVSVPCLLPLGLPLRVRKLLLLGGMALGLQVALWQSADVGWAYSQSRVVSVCFLLLGPRSAFGAAALLSGATLLGGRSMAMAAPLTFLWATTIVSWLGSANLYTVLRWAMDSQARAWRTAREVERRREELRRTLDSLRHAHAALERTARELEAARAEAEEARQVKARFVANISHELRTPLNIIIGFAELLAFSPETYGSTPWPPALREDVMAIWRNAEHLLKMIDDVLDLAQIEAARLPIMPEETELCQLIRETLVSASQLLRSSGLELRVQLPAQPIAVRVDRTRIRQVLLNLINNAVRFTPKGFVEVGCYKGELEAVVYVRDTGEGIPPDKLEKIFEEFEQADSSLRRRPGAGLGLAISRHFVRLHGGRIWAESELGEGSTFYFTVPLPRASVSVQPVQPRRPLPAIRLGDESTTAAVVLCRDPLAQRLLERHLSGMKVFAASSAQEAIELVAQWHPDLVFVVAEPGGWEAAVQAGEAIVRGCGIAEVPVLVAELPTERRAGISLGVRELLIKPVTHREVVAAIQQLCPGPRKFLVVEDDLDMLTLLQRMLQREWPKAQVYLATSGEEAEGYLGFQPDIILLDLAMPGMGGAAFLARLRSCPQTRQIPVLVVTARGPAQQLAGLELARLQLLRGTSLSAGELVRLLELVSRVLPPRYVPRPA